MRLIIFSLFLLLLPPTKEQKTAFHYMVKGDWVIENPTSGWKFLSFDSRRNIYLNGNSLGKYIQVSECEMIMLVNDSAVFCTLARPDWETLIVWVHLPLRDPVMLRLTECRVWIKKKTRKVKMV